MVSEELGASGTWTGTDAVGLQGIRLGSIIGGAGAHPVHGEAAAQLGRRRGHGARIRAHLRRGVRAGLRMGHRARPHRGAEVRGLREMGK